MQYTPMTVPQEKWVLQFEVQGAWKSRSTGWMFSDDQWAYRDHVFDSIEKAIMFCKYYGVAYEVEIPKSRNFSFKSYAHNFLWKGEPEVESEDIEE